MRHRSAVAPSLLALGLTMSAIHPAPVAATANPPNIIVILTDDQRWDTLDDKHGHRPDASPTPAVMPHVMARLVANGVNFTSAFVTTPLCAPSRASLLTGQRASTHGVKENGPTSFAAMKALEPTLLPVWLQSSLDHPYRTGYFGKYSNKYGLQPPSPSPSVPPGELYYVPPGWSTWFALVGQGAYYDPLIVTGSSTSTSQVPGTSTTVNGYSTEILRDQVIAFINATPSPSASPAPFFVVFAPKASHGTKAEKNATPAPSPTPSPYPACRLNLCPSPEPDPSPSPDASPAPSPEPRCPIPATVDLQDPSCPGEINYRDSFNGNLWRPPSRPPSFNEEDVSDKPQWVQHARHMGPVGEQYVDAWRQRSLETLQSVDDAVEQIVMALAARGLIDNTVIVYTSDNGFGWGEHRLMGKNAPYEESIRIPLVIKPAGGGLPGGREDTSPVLNIDLAPTIAALAGVAPQRCLDGKSLVPLLQAQVGAPLRDRFAVEHFVDDDDASVPAWAAWRQLPPKRVYVELGKDPETGLPTEKEYYGFLTDPSQLSNRANDGSDVLAQHGMASAAFHLRLALPGWAPPEDLIFGSSFECQDETAGSGHVWSSRADTPRLRLGPEAGLSGTGRGLAIDVLDGDTAPVYVQDDSPLDESQYRVRFAFVPNEFTPGPDSSGVRDVTLFYAGEPTTASDAYRIFTVVLRKDAGGYNVVFRAHVEPQAPGDPAWKEALWPITDAAHVVEIDWKKQTTPGTGYLKAWVDTSRSTADDEPPEDRLLSSLFTGDHSVQFVRLGAISFKSGSQGTLYLDEFASRHSHFIGP